MLRIFSPLRRMDWLLILPPVLLSLLGIAVIGSVGLASDPPSFASAVKQAVALGIGVVLAFALTFANYRILDHYARPIVGATIVLLVAVLFFGKTVNGTQGWFQIAGWGLQPVELAKIATAIVLARFMSAHAHLRDIRSLGSSAVVVGVFTVLVLLQPDTGSALLLVGMWLLLLLFAGVKKRHLVTLLLFSVCVMTAAWFFLLKDYQKERILTFVDPSRAPLTRGYHTAQATIAIGAGGLFGRGLGFGSQSQLRFLPEAQTDFVFAVIGEELGFAAVAAVFALYLLFFLRIIHLSRRSRDNFTFFLTMGLAMQIFLSLVVNAGMNLGLLPVTGITLPFLSAGGSSLLATWCAVGILESIAVRSDLARVTLTPEATGVTIEL